MIAFVMEEKMNYLRPMLTLPGKVVEKGKSSFTIMSYNVLAQSMVFSL